MLIFHFYFIEFFFSFPSLHNFLLAITLWLETLMIFFQISYLPLSTNMQSKEDGFLPSFMI